MVMPSESGMCHLTSLRAGGYFMMGLVLELYGCTNGAFTLDVQLVLNENLGGILGGTQC
jgi:hypothetical protein